MRLAHPLALFATMLLQASLPTLAAADPATAFTLANGLEVVVLPDHRLPIVTHVVYYRAGSADDPPGNSGIAHYLEHLMFKGTRRFPAGHYALIVTRAGGTNNAYTSVDKTYYYEQLLKDGLPKIMELDADRMAGLDFPPAEAENELKVVLEERRGFDNDPESVLAAMTGRALYGTAPYAHPVLGDWAETGKLTLAAALAFHASHYAPGNAILVVAGDTTPETVRGMAEATYGRLPAGPPQPSRAWANAPPPCPEGRIEERHQRVARDKASVYFLTPGASGMGVRTAAALRLLAGILEDQGTSPLWRDLAARQGLIGGLSVSHDLRLAAGEFAVTVEAEAGVSAAQLERALRDALAELRRTGIDPAALAEAKRHWLADRLLNADNQLGEATRYGEQLAIGRTVAEIENEPKAIAAVTLPDVNAVLRDFLSNRCFLTALLEGTGAPAEGAARAAPTHSTTTVH